MVHVTVYVCVWVSGCVGVGVCVGVWFRVSAWRVGAWVCGCVCFFFLKNISKKCFFFLFFLSKIVKSLKSIKSKLSKTPGGVFSF